MTNRLLSRVKLLTVACCACVVLPSQAGNWNVPLSARDLKNPVPITRETQTQATSIYANMCVECHGQKGAGDGTKSKVEYDLRYMINYQKQADGNLLTDGELYWKITHGVAKMPAYSGRLTDEERWLIVNHLRVLSEEYLQLQAKSAPSQY